jgi:chemotaxis protein MotB
MSSTPSTLHRKREEPEDEGWLITFADMCVLLMCFFVLLFSMSAPDETRMRKVAESLREKGFYSDTVPTEDPYEKIKKELSTAIAARGFDKFVAASETPKGIDIEISSVAFFVEGSAKFTPEALPMLELIATQILPSAKSEIMIEVAGHTDDMALNSQQYPSNWELSAARAANVVRFLISKGFPPEKMRVVGMAATQPKAPNRDASGTPIPANQDLNRRVVLKLLKGEDQ